MDASIEHAALGIQPRPSLCNELSLGTTLSKVGRDGCKIYQMCKGKESNLIDYFLVISLLFHRKITAGWSQVICLLTFEM